MSRLILLVAEGFGIGRSPVAPGTFGTLLGFVWIYLLLLPQNVALYIGGAVLGLFGAVVIGSRAEEILKKKDPGSIVIDEIASLPIVFLPVLLKAGAQPPFYFLKNYWVELVLTFVLFRVFDIWKPLGIRRSQDLPGGLVLDDALAAVAAGIALSIYLFAIRY